MSETLVAADVYDRLQQVMASDPEGFCELYRDYLSDAQQTLSHLRALYEEQSADELRFKAHYLKSSSLILGIRPVADLCSQLESSLTASELTSAGRSLQELADLLKLVQRELEQRLGPQVIPAAA
jgi:HPt (histidine-containing phosphotransfer) domain-containing protein